MPEGKRYLGDGVYVECENDWMVVLTTENGESVQNRIYLEPGVLAAFLEWLYQSGFKKVNQTAKEN